MTDPQTPIRRATTRPAGLTPPAHWKSDPAPKPQAAKEQADPDGLNPVRYGDWEHKGLAIDF